ncbi:SNF2-related protein [Amphibiibacter pelophylacis]|uniref:DEAD/DEAH box helicase n=1 Tax=Amphibiibacter pelophylacis TaxID=1799477 RepID=A0ACC6NYG6_9BURK
MNIRNVVAGLGALERSFDAQTVVRGRKLFVNGQVLNWEIAGDNAGTTEIHGLVQGSLKRPYDVSVYVEATASGTARYSAWCTCPMQEQCKHGVALVLHALAQEDSDGLLSPPGTPAVPAESDPGWLWLQQMDRLARSTSEDALPVLQDNPLEDQLVLLLEPHEQRTPAERPLQAGRVPAAPQTSVTVLSLRYGVSRQRKSGEWNKLRRTSSPNGGQGGHGSDTLRDIFQLIDMLGRNAHRTSYYSYDTLTEAVLRGPSGLMALELAARSGRLFSSRSPGQPGVPLAWGGPQPLTWRWQATPEQAWQLRATLTQEGAQVFLNEPPIYINTALGLCGPAVADGVPPALLPVLLQAPPLSPTLLRDHPQSVMTHLGTVGLPPGLDEPLVVRGEAPQAQIELHADGSGLLLCASLGFDYGGHTVAATDLQTPKLLPGTPPVLIHRALAAEQSARQALSQLGLVRGGDTRWRLAPEQPPSLWLAWLDSDFVAWRDLGLNVRVPDPQRGLLENAQALHIDLSGGGASASDAPDDVVSSTPLPEWFDLSLGLEVQGQRINVLPLLPQLIAQLPTPGSARASVWPERVFLPRGDGRFWAVPTEPLRPWLSALVELTAEDRPLPVDGDLRLSRLEALRLGSQLAPDLPWAGAKALQALIGTAAGGAALPSVPPPAGLNASLRPYQQHGLDWLQFLGQHGLAGLLADDMGLGKTLQTLAHILAEREAGRLDRPVLVVAPVSLLGNWRNEATRFTPALRVRVHHGLQRHEDAVDLAQHDIILTSYALLVRDIELWRSQAWHLVVLDEAQHIKNARTRAAQAAGELSSRQRLCLSGTPMENHLGELWSLFHFLMPGFLGSSTRFRTLFRTPIEKQGDGERLAQLRRRIAPFMLRRTKSQVASELPPRQDSTVSLELGGTQADLYETIRLTTEASVREALALKGLGRSHIQVLDALLKLRQVCCDPRLVKLDVARGISASAKLDWLRDTLPDMIAEGRRVLIFSQFTQMLALIEPLLAELQLPWVKLTGQTRQRDAVIARFTQGEVPIFLISLKAGGVGLNLPQADTVIHCDPWWNPAAEDQASDRAHRIGQTQKVMVYKLVAAGTIEERVLALQERKAGLARGLYADGGVATGAPRLSESDIAELLAPLA